MNHFRIVIMHTKCVNLKPCDESFVRRRVAGCCETPLGYQLQVNGSLSGVEKANWIFQTEYGNLFSAPFKDATSCSKLYLTAKCGNHTRDNMRRHNENLYHIHIVILGACEKHYFQKLRCLILVHVLPLWIYCIAPLITGNTYIIIIIIIIISKPEM